MPPSDRFLTVLLNPTSVRPENIRRPTPDRVALLRSHLSAQPCGFGPTGDAPEWRSIDHPLLAVARCDAQRFATKAPPELTDELYLTFSRTGSRHEYERPYRTRLNRLKAFAVATLAGENHLPALEREISAILSERTWVMPASDPWLDTFSGRDRSIDLGASARAWALAVAAHWFGKSLTPSLLTAMREEIRTRVWQPYLETIAAGNGSFEDRWITRGNNWNPVCHAGVVSSALALEPDLETRALLIASAEANLPFYLEGFCADGACTEGLSYWNYGYSHYVMLAETVRAATEGKVDWLQADLHRQIAAYPQRIALSARTYAWLADCAAGMQPLPWLQAWLASRPGFPAALAAGASAQSDSETWLHGVPFEVFAPKPEHETSLPDRESLPAAQIWTWRCRTHDDRIFAMCSKGGNNDDFHNHNDVGSFVIALDGEVLVADPGAETYIRDTFGPQRYESAINSSLGHSVPLLDGKPQLAGPAAQARVVSERFGERDEVALDLTSAYGGETVVELLRRFELHRLVPRFSVTDTVVFRHDAPFETAFITLAECRPAGPNRFELRSGRARLLVEASSDECTLRCAATPLDRSIRDGRIPQRISFFPASPRAQASITVTFTPAPHV